MSLVYLIWMEDLGACCSGKGGDGLSSSRFSLRMGSGELCLPVAQGPSKWGYGVGEEGAPWGSGGQVPAACPRPAPSLLAGSHTSPQKSWLLLLGRGNPGEGQGASLGLAA